MQCLSDWHISYFTSLKIGYTGIPCLAMRNWLWLLYQWLEKWISSRKLFWWASDGPFMFTHETYSILSTNPRGPWDWDVTAGKTPTMIDQVPARSRNTFFFFWNMCNKFYLTSISHIFSFQHISYVKTYWDSLCSFHTKSSKSSVFYT